MLYIEYAVVKLYRYWPLVIRTHGKTCYLLDSEDGFKNISEHDAFDKYSKQWKLNGFEPYNSTELTELFDEAKVPSEWRALVRVCCDKFQRTVTTKMRDSTKHGIKTKPVKVQAQSDQDVLMPDSVDPVDSVGSVDQVDSEAVNLSDSEWIEHIKDWEKKAKECKDENRNLVKHRVSQRFRQDWFKVCGAWNQNWAVLNNKLFYFKPLSGNRKGFSIVWLSGWTKGKGKNKKSDKKEGKSDKTKKKSDKKDKKKHKKKDKSEDKHKSKDNQNKKQGKVNKRKRNRAQLAIDDEFDEHTEPDLSPTHKTQRRSGGDRPGKSKSGESEEKKEDSKEKEREDEDSERNSGNSGNSNENSGNSEGDPGDSEREREEEEEEEEKKKDEEKTRKDVSGESDEDSDKDNDSDSK